MTLLKRFTTTKKKKFKKVFLFQNLPDTDSPSMFFLFLFVNFCVLLMKKLPETFFEVLTKSEVLNRLDLSDNFWEQFNVQNKSLKKQVGLYKVENINKHFNNCHKSFEKYKNFSINKKHKGLKNNIPEIDFGAYTQRLATLHEHCFESKQKKLSKKDFR